MTTEGTGFEHLSAMQDQVGSLKANTAKERRSVRLLAAETALRDGWTDELGEVLDALGLGGAA